MRYKKETTGALGQAGFYTIIFSFGAQLLATVAFTFGSEALEWLSFPVGLLGAIVGFALYGAATLRESVAALVRCAAHSFLACLGTKATDTRQTAFVEKS
jgi:hypothetical protein